jgi:hypothetical protein
MVTAETTLIPKAFENVQKCKLLLAKTEQISQDAQTLECNIRDSQEQIRATWRDIQDTIKAQQAVLQTGINYVREMQKQIEPNYNLKQEGK